MVHIMDHRHDCYRKQQTSKLCIQHDSMPSLVHYDSMKLQSSNKKTLKCEQQHPFPEDVKHGHGTCQCCVSKYNTKCFSMPQQPPHIQGDRHR